MGDVLQIDQMHTNKVTKHNGCVREEVSNWFVSALCTSSLSVCATITIKEAFQFVLSACCKATSLLIVAIIHGIGNDPIADIFWKQR